MPEALARSVVTPRFNAQRERVLDAGSQLINERGLKGLSLGIVAAQIGLGGSSVTYYFRRKELLAAACYDRTLERLEARIADAIASAADTRGRIADLLHALAYDAAVGDRGEGPRFALLHEMRATADPQRAQLIARWFRIFRAARDLFDPPRGAEGRLLQVMRTQVLLEVAHTLPTLLAKHVPAEHDRVVDRLIAILVGGLAPADASYAIPCPAPVDGYGDAAQERFLDAATRLINERGYRGASVERIASALKVTKGSFYHHLDAKDDLAIACLDRSLGAIGRAQDAGFARDGSQLDRLAATLGELLVIQFGDGTPLLRSTALAALPPELMRGAVDQSERTRRRFSGVIADGVIDGSIVAVDPSIAGQVVMAALNTAHELRDVARQVTCERAIALYASVLLRGLAAPPPR